MLREQLPGFCPTKKKAKVIIEQNKYEIKQMIGHGTFGKVYQGLNKQTNQKVAIKQVFQDPRFKNRELEIISRLNNDNVIFMDDYYFMNKKEDRYLYLVMKYYENSLQGLIKDHRKNKTSIQVNVRKIIIFQLFKALYYLKNNSLCHRDLKPPNILINPQNYQLRICDFGSAKFFDKVQKNVSYICSRYYRAPELLFEYAYYGMQIDMWSAGCIIIQLMTKQPIFPGDSALEQLIQIMKIMGTPSKGYLRKYASQICDQLTLPQVPSAGWKRVLKKYSPQPELLDLIQKIMVFDVDARLTPIQAMKHKYFHDLVSPKYQKYLMQLPNFFEFNRLRTVKNAKQILQLQQIYIESYKNKNSGMDFNGNEKNRCGDQEGYKLETNDSTPQILYQLNNGNSGNCGNIVKIGSRRILKQQKDQQKQIQKQKEKDKEENHQSQCQNKSKSTKNCKQQKTKSKNITKDNKNKKGKAQDEEKQNIILIKTSKLQQQ